MRKLKLQVQMTIDGFVSGPNDELDWMTHAWDEEQMKFVTDLHDTIDTILMGRKMTAGFTGYWENVVDNQPDSPEHAFAKLMVDTPKVVFSKTQKEIPGRNVITENGDQVTAVNALKAKPGKDMIVYGGAGFVTSLIENNLVDELYLFINPIAIGNGKSIFNGRKPFTLLDSKQYKSGIVINKYAPAV
jgi:dihydrofolate reductase